MAPNSTQNKDREPTCRCVIHWCGKSHWNTQIPILFVCLGLTSLLNIWGHIATVPARKCGTLINALPHRNVMLRYTVTHFNVLGQTRSGNTSPTIHTRAHQRPLNLMLAVMVIVSRKLGRNCTVPTGSCTRDLRIHYITLSARPQLLLRSHMRFIVQYKKAHHIAIVTLSV